MRSKDPRSRATATGAGRRCVACLLAAGLGLAGGCGTDGTGGADGTGGTGGTVSRPPASRSARPDPARVAAAADRAAGYLRAHRDTIDPVSLALVAWIGERFGRAELAALRAEAVALARAGEHRGGSTVLGRLVDPALPAPEPASLAAAGTDGLLYRAAFCTPGDEPGLRTLRGDAARDVRRGGYATTHAGVALVLADQAGCPLDPDGRLRRRTVARLAGELGPAPVPGDLSFEQAAILDLLGAWPQVPAGPLVARMVGAQRADGSFPWAPGARPDPGADWHPTMLGLWVLERRRGPGRPVPFLAR